MASVELDGERIYIDVAWTEKELIKLVPGVKWDIERKRWRVPVSWASCVALRGVFGDQLVVGPELVAWSQREHAERVAPALAWREQTTVDGGWLTNLFPYQQAGVCFMQMAESGLLADDMGTGKSMQLLELIAKQPTKALPALIICPNSMKSVWARYAATWCPVAHPYVVDGSLAKRRKIIADATDDPLALVIINLEGVRAHSRLAPYGSIRLRRCVECNGNDEISNRAPCETHRRDLNLVPFQTVVVDEAHRMKDPQAKQTRACWAVQHGPTVTRRWALTGTPIANHPGDLWAIMHGVAPKDYPSKGAYQDRYCLMAMSYFGGLEIVGVRPDTRDEFFKVLNPRMRRMPKALVLRQLPPKARSVRYAPMTPKQAKAYRELEADLYTTLDDGSRMLSPNSLALASRLLQFSSTYAEIDGEGHVHLKEPSPKIDVLVEILEEMGGRPVAICAESRQLIELAAARLEGRGETVRQITGAVPQHLRESGLLDFQEGRARCMLFTVKAGGVGLTMTAADTIVFLQRSWSMLDNRQAEDRVHRIGAEIHEAIHVVDIVAPDTIEEEQIRRLLVKAERLEEIVRDRQRLNDASIGLDEESELLSGLLLS